MRTLIKNGILVTAENSFLSDILISDGIIQAIGESLVPVHPVDRIIQADGYFVFPGAIDPHVHMSLPTPGGRSSDDFRSGGIAALMGGTTTLIDFVTPQKGQSLAQAIEERKQEADDCPIDYTFHVSPVEWHERMPDQIRETCHVEGLRSFKVYMAYKDTIGLEDEAIYKVMEVVAEMDGLVLVHCEMGDEITRRQEELALHNQLEPRFHAISRPADLEAEAVKRVIDLAERAHCQLYIVHVSSEKSLHYISEAREKGLPVFAETCPQYLLLDDSEYQGDAARAARYVMSPPLRTPKDNLALWDALQQGILQSVGTDHCPFTNTQKMQGLTDFRKIPGGVGGVEHRMSLLYTYGVLTGKMTLPEMVAKVSTHPAQIFGLYPAKGSLTAGADADLVLWDPEPEHQISVGNHHQHCDFNIYEGFPVRGRAAYVFSGGTLRVDQGRLVQPELRGRFLKTHPF